ncbi:hypothetical protein ACA910_004119 [Epithemia clementina (nom. ined.)]
MAHSLRKDGISKHKRREARRERRHRRRRMILLGLLATAVSPSIFAFYYSTLHSTKPLLPPGDESISKEKRIFLNDLNNPFALPEDKDPNFGLPQIIVHRQEPTSSSNKTADPVQCSHIVFGPCCAPWTYNTDVWWTNHYDWELGEQNMTHTCFIKIADKKRVQFLHELRKLQFNSDCLQVWQRSQISSGYAAALSSVARAFYASYMHGKPFQYNRHKVNATWNFASKTTSHWAYCPARDMSCYYLPLGSCEPVVGLENGERGEKPQIKLDRYRWLRWFSFRPRHQLRYKLALFMNEHHPPNFRTPCSAIHVRRTDIAYGKNRRYLAVQEYLDAGKIRQGETVVVLTDDASTIDEIMEYHKSQYNWVYLERPRFRGAEGGHERHIPSKDPTFEVLSIMAELTLASHCKKLVHGKSGFATTISEAMLDRNGEDEVEFVFVENQQDKNLQQKLDGKVRAKKYLDAIRDLHEKIMKIQ